MFVYFTNWKQYYENSFSFYHLEAKSDSNEIHADDSNIDGESDNETNTSMKIESKPFISQGLIVSVDLFFRVINVLCSGSSGLLLLAAAAEQKRRDEEGSGI